MEIEDKRPPDAATEALGTQTQQRQLAIWRSRVHRELDKCRVEGALPRGASLCRVHVSERSGICDAEFHCFVPFQDGSDALALVPLVSLRLRMPFSPERVARGDAQYPFTAPEVQIRHGAIYLPTELRRKEEQSQPIEVDMAPADDVDVPKEPSYLLRLPLLTHWSPSNTLVMLLHEFFALVQQGDPQPIATAKASTAHHNNHSGNHAHMATGSKRAMRMRKRDLRGTVYACQEVDPRTSTLRPAPLLLQSGNLALLLSSSEVKSQVHDQDSSEYVYVGDLIPLRDVVRITPQRGKSLTLFFKDRAKPCRTFLSPRTDEIVEDLRVMISASSGGASKRGRDDASPAAGSGSVAQLLPFLSTESTEKAKETASKFMGKLGKVATSVGRFLRGEDDDEPMTQQTQTPTRGSAARDPLATAFAKIDAEKEAFFRTPSKARMTDVTRHYQQIAEEYAHRNNHDGYVERAIAELQAFIEHPKAQRILMETCAYEQSTRGIRVGPA